MNQTLYSRLFKDVSFGYVLVEIAFNSNKNLFEYVILDTNKAFEKITGLSQKSIINKRLSEISETTSDETYESLRLC
jgi:hypothetical protein